MNPHDGLRELLSRAGIPVAGEAARKLAAYLELLDKWNQRMNLTGSTEWNALAPLLEEALAAAALYPDRETHHLDIGSGAGFPALLMRIVRPAMALDLVEPRLKRSVFLETAAATLGLTNAKVHTQRFDAFLTSHPGTSWDSVSWKALRLEDRDLELLLERRPGKIWVFHGDTFPANERRVLLSHELERCQPLPGRNASFLSQYRLRG